VNHNSCTLTAQCRLKHVFRSALQSYLAELDKVTLADITAPLPGASGPAPDLETKVPLSAIRKTVSIKMPARDKSAQ
jgi:Rrf2 family transcriptional regulator, nitric oxide-sensitive transcriptional repressor